MKKEKKILNIGRKWGKKTEMSDYCIDCKYYTNHTEKTFITNWGDEVTLERGICSYNGNITCPSNHCDINWSEEAWVQMHIKEDEDKNGNKKFD